MKGQRDSFVVYIMQEGLVSFPKHVRTQLASIKHKSIIKYAKLTTKWIPNTIISLKVNQGIKFVKSMHAIKLCVIS